MTVDALPHRSRQTAFIIDTAHLREGPASAAPARDESGALPRSANGTPQARGLERPRYEARTAAPLQNVYEAFAFKRPIWDVYLPSALGDFEGDANSLSLFAPFVSTGR